MNDERSWITRKLEYLRFELIYALGGIPRQHINTVNYKNIGTIIADIKEKIKAANKEV